MALVFHSFPWGKFGLNIFSNLISQQIKFVHDFVRYFDQNKVYLYFLTINVLKIISPIKLKEIECYHDYVVLV